MQWTNTERGYGWIAIVLHWLAVVAIVFMLVTGFRAEFAGEAGDRAARSLIMSWHISVGAVGALLLAARVASSWLQRSPAPIEQPRALQSLAALTHTLLLIAILLQIVSGPLAVWSGGRPINVFDAFAIPSPFAERNQGVHEAAEVMHAIGRWAIIALGALHIVAVVKHALARKSVMKRMLSPTA